MTPERWQRVKELFQSAVEAEANQRPAFLAEACAGDPALRKQVEALITSHEEAPGFLEAPAFDVAAPTLEEDEAGLKIGQRIGPYEVLREIGRGGMGEVYGALDTKLKREVAIKVLPRAFAHDPERVARFRREAQLLASLNHPNIAAIYGFEESEGAHYLVLELVPGKTLAERLAAGRLSVEEALRICGQIAEALEAAHEKGIIHRDLKPANIKVTPEGEVKVLDFGLAKAFTDDVPGRELSHSPAITDAGTGRGVILGTAAYMSPEQARGKPLDKRTDIWSFGCVLYEALTGKQAFSGETASDTIAAILEHDPDWGALSETIPAGIALLLRRCLKKDANHRLHDIADARIEMEEASASATGSAPHVIDSRTSTRWVFGWALTCLVLGGIGASVLLWNLRPSPAPRPVLRMVMTLPQTEALTGLDNPAVALSPDGAYLAYVATRGGRQQLFLRKMDQFESRPIHGTEGGLYPFFSPDGEWLGFFADEKLKKVSIRGGAPLTLCDASSVNIRGACWGRNGTIVFASVGPLLQVSADGGTPQALTTLDPEKGETRHSWPEILPRGKAMIFTVGMRSGRWDDAQIVLQSLEAAWKRTLAGGTYARYSSTGHLIYALAGTLLAAPFDLERLEVTGAPVALIEGLMQSNTGAAQFSFSETGSLVYVTGGVQGTERSLVWVDRKGTAQPLSAPLRPYVHPRLSPDGQGVAIHIDETKIDVWIYDIRRDTLTRVAGHKSTSPIWTPDGRQLTYECEKVPNIGNLCSTNADGSVGEERLLTPMDNSNGPRIAGSWSPDGQWLAYNEEHPATTRRDIWVLPRLGPGQPRPFAQTESNEDGPDFSPDGRWLAYASDDSGRYQIYVQAFPGPGPKLQVSAEGGTEPCWARKGQELFYRNGDQMMAVTVRTSPDFTAGKPRLLFQAKYPKIRGGRRNYDVTADGQRFLMISGHDQQLSATQVNVVLEWFEDLKSRAGTRRK